MGFLSEQQIKARFNEIFKESWTNIENRDRFQPSSFELLLGREVFLSGQQKLVRLNHDADGPDVSIMPGDFAILLADELIKMPADLMGFITMKNRYKNMGLINISGFHVDPGFEGRLTFSVYNAGPTRIILRHRDPIFIIFFSSLEPPTQKEDTFENINKGMHHNQKTIRSDAMNKLMGRSAAPLYELESKIAKLEDRVRVQWALLMAGALGLFMLALGYILKPG